MCFVVGFVSDNEIMFHYEKVVYYKNAYDIFSICKYSIHIISMQQYFIHEYDFLSYFIIYVF